MWFTACDWESPICLQLEQRESSGNQPFTAITKSRGMGLGLSISRGIVEAHGAQLAVTSKPSAGTVFSFTLPVSQPTDETVATIAEHADSV